MSDQPGYTASVRYVGAARPFAERFFPAKVDADRYAAAWQEEAGGMGYPAEASVGPAVSAGVGEGRPVAEAAFPVGDRAGVGGRPKG